ncbi:MAG: hypothetical protein WAN50_00190 [Minisyncoccia bacterium]
MIPSELLSLPQWVVRRADKLPLNPRTGQNASVTDPSTWTDYSTAAAACSANPGVGLGFVLTPNDPYTVIDLDPTDDPAVFANHQEIYKSFNSYSELSPSGKGLHIWVRGRVESGAKLPAQHLEVYSESRYFTVTGQTINDVPILERQPLIDELYNAIRTAQSNHAGTETIVESQAQTREDIEVWNTAAGAVNGDKFTRLWNGDFSEYPSQSEADFALVDILAFYTDNMEQVERMFKQSGLGQRDKAKRKDYVSKMVKRSFDRKLPVVTIDRVQPDLAPRPTVGNTRLEVPKLEYEWTLPPGMIGEIAKYFYQSSVRPVKEISLAGALAFYAGVMGRAYNVSGTGLNQYIVILAPTGVGKEAAARGISKLTTALELQIPCVTQCIGPSAIASPQGLIKYIHDKSQCFVSQLGEFGLWLQKITDKNAKANEVGIRRALLDLYNKSGSGDVLQGAVYSDTAKNIGAIHHPAFSLIGESTQVEFYRALDEATIGDGFLPRFTVIQYDGIRPPMNEWHDQVKPDPNMISTLAGQIRRAKELEGLNQFVAVGMDEQAKQFEREFNIECDSRINSSEEELLRMLWNRAHLRLLKLSALLAVGVNAESPIITLTEMQWAHQLVIRGLNSMLARFRAGDVGKNAGIDGQNAVLVKTLRRYVNSQFNSQWIKAHRVTAEMHSKRIVNYAYIQHTTANVTCFRTAPYPSQALKAAIEDAMRSGILSRVQGARANGDMYLIQDID